MCRFLWGPAAKMQQESAEPMEDASRGPARSYPICHSSSLSSICAYRTFSPLVCKNSRSKWTLHASSAAHRAAIIKDAAFLDPRRCALSVLFFPEQCTSLAIVDHPSLGGTTSAMTAPACSSAGSDPSFMVPFCVQVQFRLCVLAIRTKLTNFLPSCCYFSCSLC